MRSVLAVFCFGCAALKGELASTEEDLARKIHSFFTIGDARSALGVSELARKIFPESEEIEHLYIRALSDNGHIAEAIDQLGDTSSEENLRKKFSLVEEIAWNQLLHYEEGKEIGVFLTMYGAAMTGDAKAVELLKRHLGSTNAYLRYLAVRLTAYYQDFVLQGEILRLLREEKNWFVRLALIDTVGKLRLTESASFLEELVESKRASAEEKTAAIRAIVSLHDKIEKNEIDVLLHSHRSGMRELGVALILASEGSEYHGRLYPLLKDSSPEVRAKVLYTLGVLPVDQVKLAKHSKEILLLAEDSNSFVAALANWLSLKFDEEKGKRGLSQLIRSSHKEVSRFVASLIRIGGKKTEELTKKLFAEVSEPYTKANLALAMLHQSSDKKRAGEYLCTFIRETKDQIMWEETPMVGVKVLAPSRVRHVPYVAGYPMIIDQMTRLDLINYVCLAGIEDIKPLLRDHLKAKGWGVAANAAILLLEEGEIEAIDIVKELLFDKDEKVALQAALALAFYAKDEKARDILEAKFTCSDWDTKIHILEALGSIGSRKSIPFFMDRMKDASPMIRKIAAAGVIQSLYH